MRPLEPARLAPGADGPAARAYLVAHDTRVQRIDRLSLQSLRLLWEAGLALQGMVSLFGGPDDHDQLVNYIADMEFPDAARARQIHYDHVLDRTPALGQE